MAFSGIFILIPIAVPNLIWVLLSDRSPRPEVQTRINKLRGLASIEAVGRVAVMVVPVFLTIHIESRMDEAGLAVAGVALSIYYAGWIRYFLGKRVGGLLFRNLGFIPVPLACSPVLYFLAISVLARSIVFGVITALFGFAHIYLCIKRSSSA